MTKLDFFIALLPRSAKPIVETVLNQVLALRCLAEEHQPLESSAGVRAGAKVREGITLYFCTRCHQAYWE